MTKLSNLERQPLEPIDYCRTWVTHPEDEWGYYKACCNALAKATGRSKRTVESWGSDFSRRPADVPLALRKHDLLLKAAKYLEACIDI